MKSFITSQGLQIALLELEFVGSSAFRNLEITHFAVVVENKLILTKWELYEMVTAKTYVEIYDFVLTIAENEDCAINETVAELRTWLAGQ